MKFKRAIPWFIVIGALGAWLAWTSGNTRPAREEAASCSSVGQPCQLGTNKRGVCSAGAKGLVCMDQH